MSDSYFNLKVKQYAQIVGADTPDKKTALLMILKEVSRDTRHAAFDLAQQHARDVVNMELEQEKDK